MLKRLKKELKIVVTDPSENISASPVDNDMTKWEAIIIGPKGTPYEDGIFKLSIDFPDDYPFVPPNIRFVTQIYHPNIDSNGKICMDVLKQRWSPVQNTNSILLSVCSLLSDPNPDDPLVPEIAHLFQTNRQLFDQYAKMYTMKFAS